MTDASPVPMYNNDVRPATVPTLSTERRLCQSPMAHVLAGIA
jgi:hypothetical protein